MLFPATYSVADTANPLVVNFYRNEYRAESIQVNRFEWYPSSIYAVDVPEIYLRATNISGKFTADGSQDGLIAIFVRNESNIYKYARTYYDPYQMPNYLQSIEFRFTDINGNLLDLGENDNDSVNYLLDFTINLTRN
jgi:hypothetical protein